MVVPDTLRFMDQAEVAAFIAEARPHAGHLVRRLGWPPCGPASPEIIAIAAGDRAASGAADD